MMQNEVTDALRALADQNNGRLTPDLVVEAARNSQSPLHRCFTWDLKQAAHERWLYQARELIRSIRVEVTTTEFKVRVPAFIRDPAAAAGVQGYVSLDRLRTDEDLSREAVVAEFMVASAALERAKAVAKALGMSEEIEEVRERIVHLSERARQVAA